MNPEITIRTERPDHPQVVPLLDALDRYLGSLYAPDDNHILDIQALLASEISFLAAWSGDRAIGCAAMRRMPGEHATGGCAFGEIKRMYVDPAARGQGVAGRLLDRLERKLVDDGFDRALLETGRHQAEAVRLYEGRGYVARGPFADYPDNGLSLFYEKRLGP